MNRAEAIQDAMAQMKAITNGTHVNKPISVVMSGESAEAPSWLEYEMQRVVGKPVKIEWRQISKQQAKRTNNTGEITDGYDGYAEYYRDAARRGARTGD